MNYSAAIFDLDGTLLDSLYVWDRVDTVFLGRRGFSVPADYKKAIASLSFRETADYTIRRFALRDTPEALMEEWIALATEEYTLRVPLRPGASAFVHALKDAGLPLSVGTTLDERMLYPCLSRLGVLDCFGGVYTTGALKIGKHSPRFFQTVAGKMEKAPADILVFDDVADVLLAAKTAGMQVCALGGGSSPLAELREVTSAVIPDFLAAPMPSL